MKLSFDWLGDYVDLTGISPQELAEKLTMGAFEVEEVTVFGPDLVGPIVVGEILEIHPHPNADKIRLTKTRIEEGAEPLEIVCGAQNIEVGMRVPVALPGARVINRKDGTPLPIKASAIRGVHSNGMLCSPPELGIDMGEGTSEGILVLNANGKTPALGQDIKEVLGIKTDYILHVEPRSNRGDALSVQGLAREVAALFNRPLKAPLWSMDELTTPAASKTPPAIWLEGEDNSDCPFFSLQEINNVKIGPAPAFIARRLEAIGLRPVNNVVDITNYVMHELGQPLHAYDKDKLKHPAMGVRRARAGEQIVTLDGRERALTEEMLVIVDGPDAQAKAGEGAAHIVGVAGIMGGKDSEVSDSTQNLMLEAACFSQAVVRRGSRLLGLSSDASLRFERGVDAASVLNASCRAAYLIGKYCTTSGTQAASLGVCGSDKVAPVQVPLRSSQIKRLLGLHIEDALVKDLLTPLGFSVEGAGENMSVAVPSFRQSDVKREIDLIEEVCRLNGYDKIASAMPSATFALVAPDDTLNLVRSTLRAQGLSEAWLSSLVPADTAGLSDGHLVSVLNPLSKDHQALRQSLAPGLLQACAYNQDRGAKAVWLFESGRVYLKGEGDTHGTGVKENLRLAGIVCGEKFKAIAAGQKSNVPVDYFLAKGLVENIFSCLGIDLSRIQFLPVASGDGGDDAAQTYLPWLHPYRSALVALNRPAKPNKSGQPQSPWDSNITLGYVGQVHPKLRDQLGLRQDAFVFELDIDKIKLERKAKKFSEIATSPSIVRDLTADFDKTKKLASHQQATNLIGKKAGNYMRQLELVSIFESDKEPDKVSISYRLTFQHPSETLTSEEIDKVMAGLRDSMTAELGASFRL
ncbi:MAG: phenylalanine--tRNA ligase subunit beta [Cyanobacteria bacterium SZAS TMP-1]|nr:phenylalanine--tRNA ligase subunit beta [Cyanobacteria bacterium SZAS TMP-1]